MDKIRMILAEWSEGMPQKEFRAAEKQYDELLAYVERLEGYLDERNTMVAATKERYWSRPKWLAQSDAVSVCENGESPRDARRSEGKANKGR